MICSSVNRVRFIVRLPRRRTLLIFGGDSGAQVTTSIASNWGRMAEPDRDLQGAGLLSSGDSRGATVSLWWLHAGKSRQLQLDLCIAIAGRLPNEQAGILLEEVC